MSKEEKNHYRNIFQSTPPHGRWRTNFVFPNPRWRIFKSTPPYGRWLSFAIESLHDDDIFQSTPPYGRWPFRISLPKKEVSISIHTSVWEVTRLEDGEVVPEPIISIHTSVWEVTLSSQHLQGSLLDFNPHLRMGGDKFQKVF